MSFAPLLCPLPTVVQLPFKTTANYLDLDLRGYAPGTYFCTLVVNGVPVQTKRMLVE